MRTLLVMLLAAGCTVGSGSEEPIDQPMRPDARSGGSGSGGGSGGGGSGGGGGYYGPDAAPYEPYPDAAPADPEPDPQPDPEPDPQPASCEDGPIDLGTLPGDEADMGASMTGTGEAWAVVTLAETSGWWWDLTARIELVSPADGDYDLEVACGDCGGAVIGASSAGPGELDRVDYEGSDWSGDDTTTLILHVVPANATGEWTLNVSDRPYFVTSFVGCD